MKSWCLGYEVKNMSYEENKTNASNIEIIPCERINCMIAPDKYCTINYYIPSACPDGPTFDRLSTPNEPRGPRYIYLPINHKN